MGVWKSHIVKFYSWVRPGLLKFRNSADFWPWLKIIFTKKLKTYLNIILLLVMLGTTMSCNQNSKVTNSNQKADLSKSNMDTREFFTAVRNGDLLAVKNQLKNNIDINSKDGNNETAIIIATDKNNMEMVKFLLENGANVNIKSDKTDNTPIMIASVKGYTDIVELLAEKSNPDMTILNGYGGTALIPACERGHVAVVKLLLEKTNVNVNHVNKLGWTALLEAIILSDGGKGQQEIVSLLLSHGADKNIADKNGITPLEHAMKMGYRDLANILSK